MIQQTIPHRRRAGPFLHHQNAPPPMPGPQMPIGNVDISPGGEDEVINENMTPLTDNQLILTSCVVKGYSMKAKRWGVFSLHHNFPRLFKVK